MDGTLNNPDEGKIGSAFASRLHNLAPEQMVSAILMLGVGKPASVRHTRRQSQDERNAAIDAVKAAAAQALPEIDTILKRFGGRRLADAPSALGTIPIETTAKGIDSLAASDRVRVILEDQPVSLMV